MKKRIYIFTISMGLFSILGFGQKLPEPNELYDKFVKPWDDSDEPLLPKILKPDMQEFFKAGYGLNKLKNINPEFENAAKEQVDAMFNAALEDFQNYGKFSKENLLEAIDKVDKNLNRKLVYEIIKNSDHKKFDNEYILNANEFGALIGKYFEKQPGYFWFYQYPYWESVIVHQKTGTIIPVFHWGYKKLSEYGLEDGFKLKVLKAVEIGKR